MSTGKVLASTSTADSARSLARTSLHPAPRGRGGSRGPWARSRVRRIDRAASSPSARVLVLLVGVEFFAEFVLQREHVADVREVYPVRPDISIERTGRNVGASSVAPSVRSRVRKGGTGTVPVTPTFKLPTVTFREIQSRDSQHPRTGC